MKKTALLLLLLAFVISGCSQFALVNSETYNDADLRSYSTFRIVTPAEGKLPPGMEMVTYYNIAAAIREQMVERGFREDPSSPLLINVALTVKREITTAPAYMMAPPGPYPYYGPYYPYYMYPPTYWANYSNAQVITGMYKEGVLTMDFVNIDRKLPLYSASVATIINTSNGQFRNLESIAKAVNTLFSKFPVKVLPQYQQK